MKTALLLLMMIVAAGCDQADLDQWDIQKQYPSYPDWGWWDNPAEAKEAEKATQAEATADSETPSEDANTASTPQPVELVEESEEDWPDRRDSDKDAVTGKTDDATLFAADVIRKQAWPEVEKLRSLVDFPEAKQQALLASLKRNLPGWYKQIGQVPPDATDPLWQMIVVWDFMPNAAYWHAAEGWKLIAKKRNVEFPDPITRRKLVQFILKMTQSN
jgi:hypothetical protein